MLNLFFPFLVLLIKSVRNVLGLGHTPNKLTFKLTKYGEKLDILMVNLRQIIPVD